MEGKRAPPVMISMSRPSRDIRASKISRGSTSDITSHPPSKKSQIRSFGSFSRGPPASKKAKTEVEALAAAAASQKTSAITSKKSEVGSGRSCNKSSSSNHSYLPAVCRSKRAAENGGDVTLDALLPAKKRKINKEETGGTAVPAACPPPRPSPPTPSASTSTAGLETSFNFEGDNEKHHPVALAVTGFAPGSTTGKAGPDYALRSPKSGAGVSSISDNPIKKSSPSDETKASECISHQKQNKKQIGSRAAETQNGNRLSQAAGVEKGKDLRRALRPRPKPTASAKVKKRTRFHEVTLGDEDGPRIVGRRIKVFWPLEKKYFYGHVKAFNGARKLQHKIVYDDKDEEWLRLQNEIFGIELLPGEDFGPSVSAPATDAGTAGGAPNKSKVVISDLYCSNEHAGSGLGATAATDDGGRAEGKSVVEERTGQGEGEGGKAIRIKPEGVYRRKIRIKPDIAYQKAENTSQDKGKEKGKASEQLNGDGWIKQQDKKSNGSGGGGGGSRSRVRRGEGHGFGEPPTKESGESPRGIDDCGTSDPTNKREGSDGDGEGDSEDEPKRAADGAGAGAAEAAKEPKKKLQGTRMAIRTKRAVVNSKQRGALPERLGRPNAKRPSGISAFRERREKRVAAAATAGGQMTSREQSREERDKPTMTMMRSEGSLRTQRRKVGNKLKGRREKDGGASSSTQIRTRFSNLATEKERKKKKFLRKEICDNERLFAFASANSSPHSDPVITREADTNNRRLLGSRSNAKPKHYSVSTESWIGEEDNEKQDQDNDDEDILIGDQKRVKKLISSFTSNVRERNEVGKVPSSASQRANALGPFEAVMDAYREALSGTSDFFVPGTPPADSGGHEENPAEEAEGEDGAVREEDGAAVFPLQSSSLGLQGLRRGAGEEENKGDVLKDEDEEAGRLSIGGRERSLLNEFSESGVGCEEGARAPSSTATASTTSFGGMRIDNLQAGESADDRDSSLGEALSMKKDQDQEKEQKEQKEDWRVEEMEQVKQLEEVEEVEEVEKVQRIGVEDEVLTTEVVPTLALDTGLRSGPVIAVIARQAGDEKNICTEVGPYYGRRTLRSFLRITRTNDLSGMKIGVEPSPTQTDSRALLVEFLGVGAAADVRTSWPVPTVPGTNRSIDDANDAATLASLDFNQDDENRDAHMCVLSSSGGGNPVSGPVGEATPPFIGTWFIDTARLSWACGGPPANAKYLIAGGVIPRLVTNVFPLVDFVSSNRRHSSWLEALAARELRGSLPAATTVPEVAALKSLGAGAYKDSSMHLRSGRDGPPSMIDDDARRVKSFAADANASAEGPFGFVVVDASGGKNVGAHYGLPSLVSLLRVSKDFWLNLLVAAWGCSDNALKPLNGIADVSGVSVAVNGNAQVYRVQSSVEIIDDQEDRMHFTSGDGVGSGEGFAAGVGGRGKGPSVGKDELDLRTAASGQSFGPRKGRRTISKGGLKRGLSQTGGDTSFLGGDGGGGGAVRANYPEDDALIGRPYSKRTRMEIEGSGVATSRDDGNGNGVDNNISPPLFELDRSGLAAPSATPTPTVPSVQEGSSISTLLLPRKNVLKLRRCPTNKSVWQVAEKPSGVALQDPGPESPAGTGAVEVGKGSVPLHSSSSDEAGGGALNTPILEVGSRKRNHDHRMLESLATATTARMDYYSTGMPTAGTTAIVTPGMGKSFVSMESQDPEPAGSGVKSTTRAYPFNRNSPEVWIECGITPSINGSVVPDGMETRKRVRRGPSPIPGEDVDSALEQTAANAPRRAAADFVLGTYAANVLITKSDRGIRETGTTGEFQSGQLGSGLETRKRGKMGPSTIHGDDADGITELPAASAAQRSAADSVWGCCTGNVLITKSDRCIRETGATVELQSGQLGSGGCTLSISVRGESKYAVKADQPIASGTTNKSTHAMMWRGGKAWSLEFVDRKQWQVFKDLHEECFQRNARAASVRHIPIPGVKPIVLEVPKSGLRFSRPPSKYIRQADGEMDMSISSSRVVYDMDSEDEDWLNQVNSEKAVSVRGTRSRPKVDEDTLERVMDKLEKNSFVEQQELVSPEAAAELCQALGSQDIIRAIHSYWLEKRQRKGMALVRHFQPAPWEQYQKQLQVWQSKVDQLEQYYRSPTAATRHQQQSLSKRPPLFAFCLRPRGLEIRNKMQKQRSQRKQGLGGSSSRQWTVACPPNEILVDSPSKRYSFVDSAGPPPNGTRRYLRQRSQDESFSNPTAMDLTESFNATTGDGFTSSGDAGKAAGSSGGVVLHPRVENVQFETLITTGGGKSGRVGGSSKRTKKLGRKAKKMKLLAATEGSRRKRQLRAQEQQQQQGQLNSRVRDGGPQSPPSFSDTKAFGTTEPSTSDNLLSGVDGQEVDMVAKAVAAEEHAKTKREVATALRARAHMLHAAADAAMQKAVAAVLKADAIHAHEGRGEEKGFSGTEKVQQSSAENHSSSSRQHTTMGDVPVAVKDDLSRPWGRAEASGGDVSFGSWRRALNSASKNANLLLSKGSSSKPALITDVDDALLPVASWSQELGAGLGTRLLQTAGDASPQKHRYSPVLVEGISKSPAASTGAAKPARGEGLVSLGRTRGESMMAMLTR